MYTVPIHPSISCLLMRKGSRYETSNSKETSRRETHPDDCPAARLRRPREGCHATRSRRTHGRRNGRGCTQRQRCRPRDRLAWAAWWFDRQQSSAAPLSVVLRGAAGRPAGGHGGRPPDQYGTSTAAANTATRLLCVATGTPPAHASHFSRLTPRMYVYISPQAPVKL